jgi:hypothetical protein
MKLSGVSLLNIADAPAYINGANVFIGQHVKRIYVQNVSAIK